MDKAADAFRTIGEVADILETPAHVLRFWESRFPQIRPIKRAGGRRYYRPADVELLGGIKRLLHDDGLTIRGVQKILKEKGVRHVAGLSGVVSEGEADATPTVSTAGSDASPRIETLIGDLFAGDVAVDEAPMSLDVTEPEPEPQTAAVHSLRRNRPDHPAAPTSDPAEVVEVETPPPHQAGAAALSPAREPAAALLRAMDSFRARDMRSELRAVYDRLSNLRARVAKDEQRNRS